MLARERRATYAPCAASAAATTNNGRGDHEAKGDARAPQQPLAPLFPPPMYPVAEGTIDTATRGDWVGRYGTAGYALFAFSNGTDVVHIPKTSPAVLAGAGGGGGGGGGLQNISFFHAPQRRFSGCLPGSNATALERPPTLTPVEARAKAEKEQNRSKGPLWCGCADARMRWTGHGTTTFRFKITRWQRMRQSVPTAQHHPAPTHTPTHLG